MKNYLLIIFILLSGCNDVKNQRTTQRPEPKVPEPKPLNYSEMVTAHIDSITNEKDTIFLGFILGSSKAQVKKHLSQLIREGKTSEKQTLIFDLLGSSMELSGYPYVLYLEDKTELPSLIDFKYLDEKLFAIDLQVYKNFDIEKVKNLLTTKYGKYDNLTEKNSARTYYWLINNTEIEAAGNVFGDIQYFDLKKKHNYENELKEAKEKIKQSGLKNTKKDI
jgi:hypothetical protein